MVSKKISRYIIPKMSILMYLLYCYHFRICLTIFVLNNICHNDLYELWTSDEFEVFLNFEIYLYVNCILKGLNLLKEHIFLKSFRGNASSNKRYRHEMLGGYGAPLIITLLTCIFQFYRPKCSIVNPRIGEYHCFFPSQWIYQSIYCLPESIHSVNSPK